MKLVPFILPFGCLLLAGCMSRESEMLWMQRMVPPADDSLARRSIELVRTGDFGDLRPLLDPALTSKADLDEKLTDVQRVLAQGKPIETTLIGFQLNKTDSGGTSKRRSDLSYQLHFPSAWVAGDVVIDTTDSGKVISGIHFSRYPASFEEMNRFSLSGKSPMHYLVLACSLAVPSFILYALIVCIRTRPIRRKWLWIVFILFGISQFQFNWTTAVCDWKPLSVLLLGSSCMSSGPYAPWILSFGLPLGAIIFLLSRRKLRVPPDEL